MIEDQWAEFDHLMRSYREAAWIVLGDYVGPAAFSPDTTIDCQLLLDIWQKLDELADELDIEIDLEKECGYVFKNG